MTRVLPFLLSLLLAATSAYAQSEEDLRQYFEGKRVVVRQDMPATQYGADVDVGWTGNGKMAFDAYTRNLHTYGVSLRSGVMAMVTKVKVKGDTIEFQLDGGGYGVFGDVTDPSVSWTRAPKSERERELERQLEYVRDHRERDRITDELEDLRRRRDRENDRRRRAAEEQANVNAEAIANRRAIGGSRFNLKFPAKLNADQLTPDLVLRALADYVAFPWLERPKPLPPPPPPPVATAPKPITASGDATAAPAGSVALKKGMPQAEVERMLGQPKRRGERTEGTLRLQVLTFETAHEVIEAQFLDAILVRYSVSSK